MITIVAPYFFPAYKAGGPIKSLQEISSILSSGNHEHLVLTRNKDIDGSLLPNNFYLPNVEYLPKVTVFSFVKYFKKSDIIWINSLYSIPFSLLPLIALVFISKKTVLISPRGQLLPGSVTLFKKGYLQFYKLLLRLSSNKIVFHYTNQLERENSIPVFNNHESIVFNNPILGNLKEEVDNEEQPENFIISFFGRIAPIKNIEFILNLLPELPENYHFHIHGAIENEQYKLVLDDLIVSLDISNRVSFLGAYNKDTFAPKIKPASIVVIPSLSENFCHVFFEAIENNKIVIGSKGLPWEEVNKTVGNTILPLKEDEWKVRMGVVEKMDKKEYAMEVSKLGSFYMKIWNEAKNDILVNFEKLISEHGNKR